MAVHIVESLHISENIASNENFVVMWPNIKKHPFSSERLSGGAYETWLLKSTGITGL